MATCDGAPFLQQQLASIAEQTVLPLELVVSDDASSDATTQIIERFAREAPFPVTLHRNDVRIGVGDNFMRAAEQCGGDLVAFADQDDVWRPHKLARSVAAIAEHRGHLVVHACSIVDDELRATGKAVPTIRTEHATERLMLARWAEAPGMAMTFDRSLLSLLPWDRRPRSHHRHGRLLHDEWVLALARLAGRVVFLPDQLVLYRQHTVNVEGAPDRRFHVQASRGLASSAEYYELRADQARDWAALLDGGEFAEESQRWAQLAEALTRRSRVHDRTRGRRVRARELIRAAQAGAYGSRSGEGFGARGFSRDLLTLALRG